MLSLVPATAEKNWQFCKSFCVPLRSVDRFHPGLPEGLLAAAVGVNICYDVKTSPTRLPISWSHLSPTGQKWSRLTQWTARFAGARADPSRPCDSCQEDCHGSLDCGMYGLRRISDAFFPANRLDSPFSSASVASKTRVGVFFPSWRFWNNCTG